MKKKTMLFTYLFTWPVYMPTGTILLFPYHFKLFIGRFEVFPRFVHPSSWLFPRFQRQEEKNVFSKTPPGCYFSTFPVLRSLITPNSRNPILMTFLDVFRRRIRVSQTYLRLSLFSNRHCLNMYIQCERNFDHFIISIK